MPRPYFALIPNRLRQQFSRVRRTTGGAQDGYGDATFTEQTTEGYRGFFQNADQRSEKVLLAGKEISYDAKAWTSATALVGEDDVLLFGSTTSTAISTRFRVAGKRLVYDGLEPDHAELYLAREVR